MRTLSNMEHSFDRVNHVRFVFDLGDEIEENVTDLFRVVFLERDVDAGGKDSARLDDEIVGEMRMVFHDPERADGIVFVEFGTDGDPFAGDGEQYDLTRAVEQEIADHRDQDECDRHERAVRIERVADDHYEREDDPCPGSFRFQDRWHVLERFPPQDDVVGVEILKFIIEILFFERLGRFRLMLKQARV